jgi:hypothetical protein
MTNYAIIENGTITNIVVAESIENVESVTSKTVVLCNDEKMQIGSDLFEGNWRLPKPFASWIWDGQNWTAPVVAPEPKECYDWNEETGNWEQKEGNLIASKITNFF